MTLTEILAKEYIKVPLQAKGKNGIIEELVDLLVKNRPSYKKEEILGAVLAREALGSTGLADGVAVPHAKTTAVDRIALVMGISPEPVDFKAQDGKGSQLFFLVLAPEKESSAYIELLASIARATASPVMRRLMSKASSSDEVLSLLLD
ncbi:MAG: PTS sugar transporter subunit IIA [Sphaerochaetaceae bacterium]